MNFSKKTIGAIVVTYNPNMLTLKSLLNNLCEQVEKVFIVDNSSSNSEAIFDAASKIESIRIILCEKNLGVGKAHNIGIKACRDEGLNAVLLLDQDTVPTNNLVYKLSNSLNQLVSDGIKTCAVGSRYVGKNKQISFFVHFSRFRFKKLFCDVSRINQIIPADMLISSGTLIPIQALDSIGAMDEGLFIDHVDTEWFLRAKSLDWNAYGVCDALMNHSLGERSIRLWWGYWRNFPVHLPFRYYFIFRNSILLYKRNYISPEWRRADIIRLILIAIILILFSDKRLRNLRLIFLGIIHGIKGKTGPLLSRI